MELERSSSCRAFNESIPSSSRARIVHIPDISTIFQSFPNISQHSQNFRSVAQSPLFDLHSRYKKIKNNIKWKLINYILKLKKLQYIYIYIERSSNENARSFFDLLYHIWFTTNGKKTGRERFFCSLSCS